MFTASGVGTQVVTGDIDGLCLAAALVRMDAVGQLTK
jgi:hypothetical protein